MITVSKLSYSYPGNSTPVLHELEFAIADSEIFGFLGPSGAGKSTTQNILIGLLRGYGGTVQIMGRALRDWGQDYYQHIGVSFELPNHYLRLTARENLAHFAALYRGETVPPMEVLSWVGLQAHADRPVAGFSKGMKIRLNLARSLIHRPQILFLDEPTAGLDPVNARRIRDLILEQRRRGATVFITTHDMGVADALCDRVAFITDGRIRALDAPETLKHRYGERRVQVSYLDGNKAVQQQQFSLDGLGENQEFMALLQTARRLQAIHSQESTLENVFIEVTGQELAP